MSTGGRAAIGTQHPIGAAPLAAFGREGGIFDTRLYGGAISLIEKARCFGESHLGSQWQTEDGTQPW